MSQHAKIVAGIVVVVLIALGAVFFLHNKAGEPNAPYATGGAAAPADDSGSLPSGTGTSDSDINQDMQSINGNLNASASDSAAVDQSVNGASSAQ